MSSSFKIIVVWMIAFPCGTAISLITSFIPLPIFPALFGPLALIISVSVPLSITILIIVNNRQNKSAAQASTYPESTEKGACRGGLQG